MQDCPQRHSAHASSTPQSEAASSQAQKPAFELTRPVFLVGFMGAGKSSVARRLARSCGIASVDVDTYIERKCGCSIKEIFTQGGEELFRRIETEVLEELAFSGYPMLVSCGGGIVVTPKNREILQQAGFVIYLEVDVLEAAGRISDTSSRPLFNDLESAQKRLEERRSLYEQSADTCISTKQKKVHEVMYEVKRVLEEEGVLCRLAK